MKDNLSKSRLLKMYQTMLKIRRFEERVGDLVLKGEIKTPCHLYIGEEAVAVGVSSVLSKKDFVFGNHRSHGHFIAKGGDIKKLMAEIFCKGTGCSKGKGGSMHIIAPEVSFLGSPPIVAASIPIAVGASLFAKTRNQRRVAVVFFGDGAVNEGVFYESLNFASLKKLPVIFVCENNLYATHMPIKKTLADTEIFKKADIFNMPGFRIDGNDVVKVYQTSKRAYIRAIRGDGPSLVECLTYRWRGHVGPNLDLDKGLRNKRELDSWMKKCPIKRLEKILNLSLSEKKKILKMIDREINEAVLFAKKSPYPKYKDLNSHIFKD